MPVEKPLIYEPGIYFLTFTKYKWLPLFDITNSYNLVYKWFDVLKKKGHHIIAYVIMPNHVHTLVGFVPTKQSINTIVGNGKRFMAYDIVARLKEQNKTALLTTLTGGVSISDQRRGKLQEVFESSFDAKLCHSYKFINQKISYIHGNPVSKKWMLVNHERDYVHCSAQYYETGQQGVYEVMHCQDSIEVHWYGKYPLI